MEKSYIVKFSYELKNDYRADLLKMYLNALQVDYTSCGCYENVLLSCEYKCGQKSKRVRVLNDIDIFVKVLYENN